MVSQFIHTPLIIVELLNLKPLFSFFINNKKYINKWKYYKYFNPYKKTLLKYKNKDIKKHIIQHLINHHSQLKQHRKYNISSIKNRYFKPLLSCLINHIILKMLIILIIFASWELKMYDELIPSSHILHIWSLPPFIHYLIIPSFSYPTRSSMCAHSHTSPSSCHTIKHYFHSWKKKLIL